MLSVSFKPASKGRTLFAALSMGLGSVIFFGNAIHAFLLNKRFASEDVVPIAGVVDNLKVNPGRRTTYVLYFHYAVFHDTYFMSHQVTKGTEEVLRGGNPVPLKYLRNSPKICRVDLPQESRREADLPKMYLFIGALLGLISIYSFWTYKWWPGGYG